MVKVRPTEVLNVLNEIDYWLSMTRKLKLNQIAVLYTIDYDDYLTFKLIVQWRKQERIDELYRQTGCIYKYNHQITQLFRGTYQKYMSYPSVQCVHYILEELTIFFRLNRIGDLVIEKGM